VIKLVAQPTSVSPVAPVSLTKTTVTDDDLARSLNTTKEKMKSFLGQADSFQGDEAKVKQLATMHGIDPEKAYTMYKTKKTTSVLRRQAIFLSFADLKKYGLEWEVLKEKEVGDIIPSGEVQFKIIDIVDDPTYGKGFYVVPIKKEEEEGEPEKPIRKAQLSHMQQTFEEPVTVIDESTLGGPGLDGYAYEANTYCEECAIDIMKELYAKGKAPKSTEDPAFTDSGDWPQPIFFGESDRSVDCAICGEHLYGEDESDVEAQRRNLPGDRYEITTWFERDRAHVALNDLDKNKTVLEWWDEEVHDAVEDGFLDPRDWKGSAMDYARHLGIITAEKRHAKKKVIACGVMGDESYGTHFEQKVPHLDADPPKFVFRFKDNLWKKALGIVSEELGIKLEPKQKLDPVIKSRIREVAIRLSKEDGQDASGNKEEPRARVAEACVSGPMKIKEGDKVFNSVTGEAGTVKKISEDGKTFTVKYDDGEKPTSYDQLILINPIEQKAQKDIHYSEIKFDIFNKGFKGRVDEISPAIFLGEKPPNVSKEALQKAMASPGDWIKVAQIGEVTVPSGIYEYLRTSPHGAKPSPGEFPHGEPEITGKLAVLVNTAGEVGEKLRNQIDNIESRRKAIREALKVRQSEEERRQGIPGLEREMKVTKERFEKELGPAVREQLMKWDDKLAKVGQSILFSKEAVDIWLGHTEEYKVRVMTMYQTAYKTEDEKERARAVGKLKQVMDFLEQRSSGAYRFMKEVLANYDAEMDRIENALKIRTVFSPMNPRSKLLKLSLVKKEADLMVDITNSLDELEDTSTELVKVIMFLGSIFEEGTSLVEGV
jgi:hypothetical protein